MHRWDAEGVDAAVSGGSAALPAELAGDGVPEFVEIMIGPAAEVLSGAVTLVADDLDQHWDVEGAAAVARPGATRTAELKATASDLVLMLYRRLPVPDADVVGDPMLVASLLSLADTT